jgi:predicted house-cleaning noncanonical NTP pyrophosphatase (MazG superfamily)
MKIYKKLIRDNIPSIIQKEGKQAEIIVLDDDTYLSALKEKLVEEAREVLKAQDSKEIINELADLQEVMDAIKDHYNITQAQVSMTQGIKAIKNGKFTKKYFLVSVDEQE